MASRVIDLIDAYLEDARGLRKPRSYIEIERSLRRSAAPLHHLEADQVGRRDIVGLLNRVKTVSGPFAANRVRAYLSAMWTWGLRSGLVEGADPVSQTPCPAQEKSRDRVLSDAELALIWRATADGGEHNRIVRLLLLTAQRRDEVGAMQWSELSLTGDQPLLILPASRTKNSRPHEVPLTDLAVAALPRPDDAGSVFGRSGVRFSAWSVSKARLDERILRLMVADYEGVHGLAPGDGAVSPLPWRLHVLRRTFSTWANESGAEPHIVEAVLNHVTGTARQGVAGIYNRAAYRVQKRELLTKWAAHIADLTC